MLINPAVSLAPGLSNKLDGKEVGIYCGERILADITAGLSYGAMLFNPAVSPAPGLSNKLDA